MYWLVAAVVPAACAMSMTASKDSEYCVGREALASVPGARAELSHIGSLHET